MSQLNDLDELNSLLNKRDTNAPTPSVSDIRLWREILADMCSIKYDVERLIHKRDLIGCANNNQKLD